MLPSEYQNNVLTYLDDSIEVSKVLPKLQKVIYSILSYYHLLARGLKNLYHYFISFILLLQY